MYHFQIPHSQVQTVSGKVSTQLRARLSTGAGEGNVIENVVYWQWLQSLISADRFFLVSTDQRNDAAVFFFVNWKIYNKLRYILNRCLSRYLLCCR